MHDRLHEPYRARLFPHLDEMKRAALHAGAYGAALSGAGPTVLALVPHDRIGAVETAFRETARRLRTAGRARELRPICAGVQIEETAIARP